MPESYIQHSITDAITGIEEARKRLRDQKPKSPVEAGVEMKPAYNALQEGAVEKDLRLAFGALQRRVLDIETSSKQRDAKMDELATRVVELVSLVNQSIEQMYAFVGELESTYKPVSDVGPEKYEVE